MKAMEYHVPFGMDSMRGGIIFGVTSGVGKNTVLPYMRMTRISDAQDTY